MEREREREDFQQEIQRLEEQLRQAARPRSPGLRNSHVSEPTLAPAGPAWGSCSLRCL